MPSYDPKANRPRLVSVESSEEAPVDALLGPADAAPDGDASDAPGVGSEAAAPPRLTAVPDAAEPAPASSSPASSAPAPTAPAPAPAASSRAPSATPASPSPASPSASSTSSGTGRRALATAAVAAGALACLVAWRGFARRRSDG